MKVNEITEGTRCWKGYEKKGMKTMFGKRVPNCVKKEDIQISTDGELTVSYTHLTLPTIYSV